VFVTFAGGYNRGANPGLDDTLAAADRAVADGRIDAAGHRDVEDEFVREILKEQGIVGVSVIGEGGVRDTDRVLPLIKGLSGLTAGEVTHLPGGECVTRPVVAGEVRWTQPMTVRDWDFASDGAPYVVKQTFVGPYSLAALAEPTPGSRRNALALAFAEALNQELRALEEAGCLFVEIDEPAALTVGDDASAWSAVHDAHLRLTAGLNEGAALEESMHLSLGLWGGDIDKAGHAALIDLPYLSYLVDVLVRPSAWRFITAIPPERGVICGATDATTTTQDDMEVHIWTMAWAAQGDRGSTRVGLAPNGPLFSIGRHFAHRKLLRLSESIGWAHAGPLQDVAEALEESPLTSSVPDLRVMAEAVAAGRAAGGA
jgi:methionine synthase II (cobalamin-independent)